MDWFQIANPELVPSPTLLIFRDRVEANLRRMIELSGGVDRLRPHVKTHKLAELVTRQLELGISRFKCATIAEAEMTAAAGASDVLLAMQPVGPNARRFAELCNAFPEVRFSAIVDDPAAARDLAALTHGRPFELLVDLDIGQHRTGIAPGPAARELARTLASTPGLTFGGWHAYDGHLHDHDPVARKAACDAAFAPVEALRREPMIPDSAPERVVAGGTPTFPFHAARPAVECSPGTCVLWDAGYARQLPDLDFQPAAVLLTRVVSRPTPTRVCLDLGHKAVASEMSHPRVQFLNMRDAVPVAHNEEHLVVETPGAAGWSIGDCVYAVPWHICPTVALHSEVWVVTDGLARDRWAVNARARRLSI